LQENKYQKLEVGQSWAIKLQNLQRATVAETQIKRCKGNSVVTKGYGVPTKNALTQHVCVSKKLINNIVCHKHKLKYTLQVNNFKFIFDIDIQKTVPVMKTA